MTAAVSPADVRIETVPSHRVAFIRHVGRFNAVEPASDRLYTWADQRGLVRPDTLWMGVCADAPDITPAEKNRVNCCLTVDDTVRPEGDVGVQTIRGGECVVVTHRGPYDRLEGTYRWLYGVWLPTSGREPADAPPFEVYRNEPGETPPEALLTDIYVILEPR